MSGHSKWSTIKRKKGANDAKRGALFTKLAREIQIAAREGADPDANLRLRLAIEKAKANSMPKENIERAIARGAGLEKGEDLEEVFYEGYGPQGVAILVKVVTDNRNRAVSEVRRVFNRANGSLGESGSVMWLFEPKGYIVVERNGHDPDELFEIAIEAGAEDIQISEEQVDIYTALEDFNTVRTALAEHGIEFATAEMTMVPSTTLMLDPKTAMANMTLIENLEDLEDVAQVYTNLEISEELVAEYAV